MRGIIFILLFLVVFFATSAVLHISADNSEVVENTYIVLNEEPVTTQAVAEIKKEEQSFDFSEQFPGLHEFDYEDVVDQTIIMQARSKIVLKGNQERLFLKLFRDEGKKIAIVENYILSDTMDIEIDFFDTGKYILRDEFFNEVNFEIIEWKNS